MEDVPAVEDIKKAYDRYDTSQFTKHKELKNRQWSMVIIYHVFLVVPAEMCRITLFSFGAIFFAYLYFLFMYNT